MIFCVEFNVKNEQFDVCFERPQNFDVCFENLQIVETGVKAEPYYGEYSVKPDFTTQTLPTKEKYMNDDVTVSPIAVERIANAAGGHTVIIGG